jgi:hypothetical protein
VKKSLALLIVLGLCSCVSQGKRGGSTPGGPAPEQPEDGEGGSLNESTCLPVVGWQEAIEGKGNTRILSQVFTQPKDPEVQRIVQLASEGKANCPTP